MVKTGFVDSVKQAVEIVKLNGKAAVNVSKDKNATLMGILIVIIGGTLSGIANLAGAFDPYIKGMGKILLVILASMVVGLIFFFVSVGIIHLLARLFGGKAGYMELFRAQSHAQILSWLGPLVIISFLGNILNFLVSLWSIVVSIVILGNVHKLSRGKAIVVVLIPVIVFMLLVVIGSLAYFGVLSPSKLLPITP